MSASKINNFVDKINSIESSNAAIVLPEIYTDRVNFIDPVKSINGLSELTSYFESLYENLSVCHFTLSNHIPNNEQHSIEWVMRFQHKKIAKNKPIEIEGASFIKFENDKVCLHRDYYDLGALVYEHMPVLGSVIKRVRNAI